MILSKESIMKFDGREINKQERLAIDQALRSHPLTRKVMTGALAAGDGTGKDGLAYVKLGGVFLKAVFPHGRAGVHEGRMAQTLSLHKASCSIVPQVIDIIELPNDSELYIDHVIVMRQAPGQPLARHQYKDSPEVLEPVARAMAKLHTALADIDICDLVPFSAVPLCFFDTHVLSNSINSLLKNPFQYWRSSDLYCDDTDRIDEAIIKLTHLFHEYSQVAQSKTGLHGDPHTGNIIFDDNTQKVTFIDFSRVCLGPPEADIRIYDHKSLEHFIRAYNREAGHNIDPKIIVATEILGLAHQIFSGDQHPFYAQETCRRLLERLENPEKFYGPYTPLGL